MKLIGIIFVNKHIPGPAWLKNIIMTLRKRCRCTINNQNGLSSNPRAPTHKSSILPKILQFSFNRIKLCIISSLRTKVRFQNLLEMEVHSLHYIMPSDFSCRSQWPCSLRHKPSSPARTLGSWVRIALEAWMSVCLFCLCLCCPACR
jgi:hypothetical protein